MQTVMARTAFTPPLYIHVSVSIQGRMMGSDMGQQQQIVYDSTGGGGYGQQQPQQQYMGMQQYGGYPQQVATVQQPQQQYGGMVQQATGYGMLHDMYCKGRVC